MARKSIWEQVYESTEGPTVTVTIPRDHAESLLKVLAASLDGELPDDMGGDEDDLDSIDDLDFGDGGDMQGPPEEDDLDGMGDLDLDFMPAGDGGDDDEDDGDAGGPPKRGRGRPPGSKNKSKKPDDGGEEKPEKDDDSGDGDEDDKKDETVGEIRPQTALGESSFAKAARALTKPRRKR